MSTTDASSLASAITSLVSTTTSSAASSTLSSTSVSRSAETTPSKLPEGSAGSAQGFEGISLKSFLGALAVAIIVFAVQIAVFLLLRNKLARILYELLPWPSSFGNANRTSTCSKPKTYLVPDRERTDAPPSSPLGMLRALMSFGDREVINKCGLDAYFFLRYLKTLLVIFVPIAFVVIPILIPLNYVDGRGQEVVADLKDTADGGETVTGLDTLAWGNIKAKNTDRYWAHLILALLVITWVCLVFFLELRVYVKVRQDYLTSAEHRLRASANTVLVNSIPLKWLSEEALRGLFDVFPGGIRNVWLNRDLTALLEKIKERNKVHQMLEDAETELIREAKKRQLKAKRREEKENRQKRNEKGLTKKERERRQKEEDEKAQRMAAAGQGFSSGEHDDVPHDIADVLNEPHSQSHESESRPNSKGGLGSGFAKLGQGILGGVGKAGKGLKTLGQDVDNTLETTNGFVALDPAGSSRPTTRQSNQRRPQTREDRAGTPYSHDDASAISTATHDEAPMRQQAEPAPVGNTVRKATNIEDMYVKDDVKFWQFWKGPPMGYASPVPQRSDNGGFPFPQAELSTWQKVKMALPFMYADAQGNPVEYPPYWNESAEKRDDGSDGTPEEWEKWLKRKDRPTHRVTKASWAQPLTFLPFVGHKVDTIDWCRKELARLNMEIEEDQKHPERYPLMSSAFIQFNHQVAAHMACQSLIHHIPKQMAPRDIEISPKDVIWDNMAISWWQEWVRGALVTGIVVGMLILWAVPVAFTASLGQLDSLVQRFHWLGFLNSSSGLRQVAQVIVGVLPAALLALLLVLVPIILGILAHFRGAKTGSQKTEFVQLYFFFFLFFQVFLIVSITSFFVASVDTLFANLAQLSDINAILNLLANNLPKAANYFFSYMILQALSTSSGTLLQVGALLTWYVLARIMDSTARSKWSRNTKLSEIKWGSFFPVYTNFACIALVYAIVAPLISIFAIITFSLLWVAQRYSMLYVTRFEHDTGGVLYPRAINQTFTGLYVMELALAGLFFIVQDEDGENACSAHGTIMLAALVLTIIYQVLLNRSFGPLFRYLPITYEDEACIRDEAFARAQAKRLGLDSDDDDDDEDGPYQEEPGNKETDLPECRDDDIELRKMDGPAARQGSGRFAPLNAVKKVGTWAQRDGGKAIRTLALQNKRRSHGAAEYRRMMREKDMETQRAIGDALFGGYHDEIEDLTPEERDTLVRYAFQHEALRARRPTVWIPRDDLGVSDGEVARTRELSEYVWISNEGTALDSKVRVVYGRAPPDFSEVDLINL